MSLEQGLRGALARAAEYVDEPLCGVDVRRHARVRRQRATATAVTTFVAVLSVALVLPFVLRGPAGVSDFVASGAPRGGGYLAWPARGNLTSGTWAQAAATTWNASPETRGPHTGVRVLYAGSEARVRTAVLTGLDRHGDRRVAVLRGTTAETSPSLDKAFAVVEDRAAPSPGGTRAMAFRLASAVESRPDTLVVVGEPDLAEIRWNDAVSGAGGTLAAAGGAGSGEVRGEHVVVTGYDAAGKERFSIEPRPRSGPFYGADERCETACAAGRPPLPGLVAWGTAADARLRPADARGHDDVVEATFVRHGARPREHAIRTFWSAMLPDGTSVYVDLVRIGGEPVHLVAASYKRGGVTFAIDRRLEGSTDDLPAVAVLVPGLRHEWLLVVTNPNVTRLRYAADGTHFTGLSRQANVALSEAAASTVTSASRIAVEWPSGFATQAIDTTAG